MMAPFRANLLQLKHAASRFQKGSMTRRVAADETGQGTEDETEPRRLGFGGVARGIDCDGRARHGRFL